MRQLAALLAALFAFAPAAWAQTGRGLTAGDLPPRGTPSASDIVPCAPVHGALEGCTAGSLAALSTSTTLATPCNGTADDTAAFAAATAAGGWYDLPAGVCVISANLTRTVAGGFRGAGKPDASGGGAATIIRPTSAVTTLFTTDGGAEGTGLYVTAGGFEDLGLDMTHMAAGTTGFYQGHAYDIAYRNVRVLNDTGKISAKFGQGAYTTDLWDFDANEVYVLGNGVDNPTTITLINPDIKALNVEQGASVTTIDGAVQPAYSTSNTVVYLAAGTRVIGYGEAPSTGVYLSLGSYLLNMQYFSSIGTDWEAGSEPPATCSVSGWAYGTFNDGTHGCAPMIMAVQIGGGVSNVDFTNPVFAGMYLYNAGGSGDNLTISGYQTGGGQGNYHEGAETFDASVYLNNGQALHCYSNDKVTQTCLIDASNGNIALYGSSAAISVSGPITGSTITGSSLNIDPITVGANFASIGDFGCYNSGVPATSTCYIGSGGKFQFLQDPAGTVTDVSIDASTGRVTSGSGMCPGAGNDTSPTLTGVTCMVSGNGNPSNSDGRPNGWFYLRGDCTHGASDCFWHKEAGAWVDLN